VVDVVAVIRNGVIIGADGGGRINDAGGGGCWVVVKWWWKMRNKDLENFLKCVCVRMFV